MRRWRLAVAALCLMVALHCESGGLWPFRPLPCGGGGAGPGVPSDMASSPDKSDLAIVVPDMALSDLATAGDMVPAKDLETAEDLATAADMSLVQDMTMELQDMTMELDMPASMDMTGIADMDTSMPLPSSRR